MARAQALLNHCIRFVCNDALFALCSWSKLEPEWLEQLAERRGPAWQAVLQGDGARDVPWPERVTAMAAAMAAIHPPHWVPLHRLVSAISLRAGARGVRSLFTSKPSDSQLDVTRSAGELALRAMTSVVAAAGPLGEGDQLVRACFAASVGLPDRDTQAWLEQMPCSADQVSGAGLDSRLAEHLVHGLWETALRQGVHASRDAAVRTIGASFGVSDEHSHALRLEVEAALHRRKILGTAAVDTVRYVLSDDSEQGPHLSRLVARLALPFSAQAEALAIIERAGPMLLARRHALEHDDRELALAIAWFAALSTDPSQSRAAELAIRHDRVANDLGSRGEASAARSVVHAQVQQRLHAAAQQAGL